MNNIITRDMLANLSANGEIARYNGKKIIVLLQGKGYAGSLVAQDNGTATVVFDQAGVYFGEDKFEIASHLYNNYTAHAFGQMAIQR